jgi:rare lipoprotein A
MYAPTTPALRAPVPSASVSVASAVALPSTPGLGEATVSSSAANASATPSPSEAGTGGALLSTVPAVATVLGVRRAVLNVLVGDDASIEGSFRLAPAVPAADAGRPDGVKGALIVLQTHGRGGWRTIAATRTGARGRYRVRYRVTHLGSEPLRLRFAGTRGERPTRRSVGPLNMYRSVVVSWYGGGGSLACGGWLTSATMGVASRTLPCGTLVTLRYDGRTVRVPVVDRGPYVEGREFDLTEATKQALGFEGVGVVWATS